MFHNLRPCNEKMFAANGTVMTVIGNWHSWVYFKRSLCTRFTGQSIFTIYVVVDIIDNNSGRAHVYCSRRRSDVLRDALQVFHYTICRPRGINFFALRLDNAGILMSREVQNYCHDYGIHLVPVPTYRHAWNGVAEKFFDTLFCMIRAIIIESSRLPGFLWNYAAYHACRLLNNCPRHPSWQTPTFKWDGTIPDISTHHVFGCRVYTHINTPLGTLEARGEEMRYLGCSHDPHFHHLYRSRDRRVFTSDDVTFVESDVQLPDFSLHGN